MTADHDRPRRGATITGNVLTRSDKGIRVAESLQGGVISGNVVVGPTIKLDRGDPAGP